MAAILDGILHYGVRVRRLAATNDLLICDRYVTDALLDLEYAFPEQPLFIAAARRAFAVAPRPDLAFLLHLDDDALNARAETKREPFPDPENTRAKRRQRYRELAASGDFVVIDASRSAEEVHASIWSHLIGHPRAPRQIRLP